MREHQIVITLKPEQFLAVQRMARAANAKSMGIYVRQQLLAALGIEGSLEVDETSAAIKDLQPAIAQLQNLHGELKTFVAESLSAFEMEIVMQASALQESTPAAVDQTLNTLPASEPTDEYEAVADRAFAISPRLGPIGQTPTDELPGQSRGRGRMVDGEPENSEHHDRSKAGRHHDVHRRDSLRPQSQEPEAQQQEEPLLEDPLEKLLPVQPAPQAPVQPAAPRPRPGRVQPPAQETEAPKQSSNAAETPTAPSPEEQKSAENVKPSTGEALGYPSLSGSPPPKRRKV